MGISQSRWLCEKDAGFVVVHCCCAFKKPALLDDVLSVETVVKKISGARIFLLQSIKRQSQTLVEMEIRLAFMTKDGRPKRLDNIFIEKINAYVKKEA
jgi:acyl-CoA thioester hydrolase